MITEEHLNDWLEAIEYQINGVLSEIKYERTETSGIKLPNNSFISFEYLNEKAEKALGLLISIKSDMVNDK